MSDYDKIANLEEAIAKKDAEIARLRALVAKAREVAK